MLPPFRSALADDPSAHLGRLAETFTSRFGELAYIAGTWSPLKSAYEDPDLTAAFGRDEAAAALHHRHRKLFADWLALSLDRQWADLKNYLQDLGDNRPQILRSWMRNRWHERVIPHDARKHERMLFLSDMDILLTLVYHDVSGEIYS